MKQPTTKSDGQGATPAGWGAMPPHLHTTRSALTTWSWYDIARTVASGLAGALPAVLLGCWWMPDLGYHPQAGGRFLLTLALFLSWTVSLTAGLCLSAGHWQRARAWWLRRLSRALLVVAVGATAVAGVTTLLGPARTGVPYLFHPLAAWALLGLVIGAGCHVAYPAERHRGQTLLAGLLAGLVLGIAFPHLTSVTLGLPGGLGRAVTQGVILFPAGVAFGLLMALVRELAKTEWLLVLFGDHPGRHYPITALPLTIGTAPDNVLVLDATGQVHPHHAVIRRTAGRTVVEPCTPDALIFLCDKPVAVSELFDGDEFQIGETMLRYYVIG